MSFSPKKRIERASEIAQKLRVSILYEVGGPEPIKIENQLRSCCLEADHTVFLFGGSEIAILCLCCETTGPRIKIDPLILDGDYITEAAKEWDRAMDDRWAPKLQQKVVKEEGL